MWRHVATEQSALAHVNVLIGPPTQTSRVLTGRNTVNEEETHLLQTRGNLPCLEDLKTRFQKLKYTA